MKKTKVTIREVAGLAGVSTATVSHVINGTYNVSDSIAERVREAMNTLGYRSNYAARMLKTQKSHIIGVIVPEIDNPCYTQVLRSLERMLSRNGYTLFLSSSQDKLDYELQQLDHLSSWNADAIILSPSSPTYNYDPLIQSLPCPVIFLDRHPNANNYFGVFANPRAATCQAVEGMIEAGYQRIACLAPSPSFPVMQQRVQGYQDAFTNKGLVVDQRYIALGEASIENGYDMMEYAIKALKATAMMIVNRKLTIGALNYLSAHGIHYPQDIGIVGYDTYGWHKACSPVLTAVFNPLDSVAAATGDLLMSLLSDPEQPARRIELESYVTDRSSY